MADKSRTLKLSILADIDDLKKKLTDADNSVGQSASGVEKFSKAAAAAFAVAGAAALAYTKQAVQNAIEDEASQRRLEETIRSSTKASADQVKAVTDYIDKTSLAIGVTDDQLRPALSRLIRSTNDVQKAQELLNLALDISAATGKPLEEVANGLGKAYDGNTNALGRMGLGIDQSILKTKNFDLVQQELTKTFGNFAENEAQSTEKQMARLKIAYDEFQEAVGYRVLPILTKFLDLITTYIMPALEKLPEFFKPVADAIERNKESFEKFGKLIMEYVVPILAVAFVGALKVVGEVAGFIIDIIGKVASGITTVVNGAISAINVLIKAYNAIPFLPNVGTIPSLTAPTITVPKISGSTGSATSVPTITVPTTTSSAGTSNSSNTSAASSASASAAYNIGSAPTGISSGSYLSTSTAPTGISSGSYLSAPTVNITVNGAIDSASTARQIADILNNEATTSGNFFTGLGSSRLLDI